jgi:hypothetical protein
MTHALSPCQEAPTTVETYKKMVARRQAFREMAAKRAQKPSPLNPIVCRKNPNSPENPCPCELLQIEAEEWYCEAKTYQTVNRVDIEGEFQHPDTLIEEVHRHLQLYNKYSAPMAVRASAELRAKLSDRTSEDSMWVQLGSPNAREMNVQRYKELLELLADMFLPGCMWFDFQFMPDEHDAYGDCSLKVNKEGYPYGLVRLHATRVEYPLGHEPDNLADAVYHRAVFRLGTLLHEVCHAFLLIYMCPKCKNWEVYFDQFAGHGWAWQRIAAQVESMAQLKLGLPLDLGRFTAIQCNWKDHKTWPSVDEVDQWDLENASTWPPAVDMVGLKKDAELEDPDA